MGTIRIARSLFARQYCNHGLTVTGETHIRVAVFWDLDNKPPKSTPPYEAARRLRSAAASFGSVRYMFAYANRQTCNHVPRSLRDGMREMKEVWKLENEGLIRAVEPHKCGVCGRRFYNGQKLANHFKQVHETEHRKRVNRIESARGKKRLRLVSEYAMKMDKYRRAATGMLISKEGCGIEEQLRRAQFVVRTVPEGPQAVDIALKAHAVDMMDKGKIECLVLVSDDSDYVDVMEEAKLRCLKTVVIGDCNEGALKRVADAGYSWPEVLRGKASSQATSVVRRWRDRDILSRMEWSYSSELVKGNGLKDEDSSQVFDVDDDDSETDDEGNWRDLNFDHRF